MAPPQSAYQVDNFETLPDEELICSICCCVFFNPVECPCRHVFCEVCIKSWLTRKKKSCPVCRKWLNSSSLRPVVPIINNLISKLRMRCPNAASGCKETITLDLYELHLTRCFYELVKCRNTNCKESILRRDVPKHEKEECKYRLVKCGHDCQLHISWYLLKDHNCVEELRKRLLEKEKLERKLKKQKFELEEKLKQLHQELERLKAANDKSSSDGEVDEEVESSDFDDLSYDSFSDTADANSNSLELSDNASQRQNGNNQSNSDHQELPDTVVSMRFFLPLSQVNSLAGPRGELSTNEQSVSTSDDSFRGNLSHFQQEIGQENPGLDRVDTNNSHSFETRQSSAGLRNTSRGDNNEDEVITQSALLSSEGENESSDDGIPFSRRRILKRKIPLPISSDTSDANDSTIQEVFKKNNGTEIGSNRGENFTQNSSEMATSSNCDGNLTAGSYFRKRSSGTSDNRISTLVEQNSENDLNEERETTTEPKEPQTIPRFTRSQFRIQERIPTWNSNVTLVHNQTEFGPNRDTGERLERRTLRSHVPLSTNELTDRYHQDNTYAEFGSQDSTNLSTRRLRSSLRNSETTHSASNRMSRTIALIGRYNVETDPDWEPPSRMLQNEGSRESNIPLRRSSRRLSTLPHEFEEGDAEDPDWQPESWTENSSDTGEEWESNSNYEVEVPPRTWDLIEQYSQDDSNEDPDWSPFTTERLNTLRRKY